MNDYERQLFNGKCPYTHIPCNKDIECFKCSVEAEERKYISDIWEAADENQDQETN